MRRMPFALIAAALVVALGAGPAAAATTKITMNDGQSFSPAFVTVARGGTVKWKNNAFAEEHDVFGTKPSSYFKSGGPGSMGPGESYAYTFSSAGRFPFVCRVHPGMDGAVTVQMTVQRLTGPTQFRLTVGSDSLNSGSAFRRVVEVDPPGSGGWQTFMSTRKAAVTYTPSARGTYYFRSRVKRSSDGTLSDASPVAGATY